MSVGCVGVWGVVRMEMGTRVRCDECSREYPLCWREGCIYEVWMSLEVSI